jgi:hypothetical protein
LKRVESVFSNPRFLSLSFRKNLEAAGEELINIEDLGIDFKALSKFYTIIKEIFPSIEIEGMYNKASVKYNDQFFRKPFTMNSAT